MKRILDFNKYLRTSAALAAEGAVLLKNNGALPLKANGEAAIFGRIQLNYYKSGTGSGGLVNVSEVVGITDGLIRAGYRINQPLLELYKEWTALHPFDHGNGWGGEPWSQAEMPLTLEQVKNAAETSDAAIIIIGRTAGEEMDNKPEKGAYFLSDGEEEMLRLVTSVFDRTVVLLNTAGIIDMSFMDRYDISSVMYVYQGGMVGGVGVASLLIGESSPSGRLTDTIAYNLADYPSDKYFGTGKRDCYCEDIFVGYRYFETFAKDKVRFPFGFGLSYTSFEITSRKFTRNEQEITAVISVKNTGNFSGKTVIQAYCAAPQGKLGKPARVLCGFEKTPLLQPNEAADITVKIPLESLASYDDFNSQWVLEQGEYKLFVGSDVRSAQESFAFSLPETVVKKCRQLLAPVTSFERMVNKNGRLEFEAVPLSENPNPYEGEEKPCELTPTGNKGIRLWDVYNGKNTLEEFTAQLSDYDLSCIIRGEGMGSPKVTAGTAAAFGGVTDNLKALGIPCGCCSDGPSGMRLDCGTKAFSLPGGTLIASSFNRELITELFGMLGLEMHANRVDCLLGPGMNIHRHPLNGRNFEYFSEDPYLTGQIAAAELKGLHSAGVEGTIKHFCGNNRETHRHFLDSVISERALREIYLKGFEIAVKEGGAKSIMTTYGSLNGVWTGSNFELNTLLLREEWDFDGFTMTDWWANLNRRGNPPDKSDFAAMAMAQNDVYMVTPDSAADHDNTLKSLEAGELSRAELQRNAMNILRFLLNTHALKRMENCDDITEIINKPAENDDVSGENVPCYEAGDNFTLDLSGISAKRGESCSFVLVIKNPGLYRVTITAASSLSELSQTPVTLFAMGTPCGIFTFKGSGGEYASITRETAFYSHFTTIRLYFGGSGLKLKDLNIGFLQKLPE